MGSPSASLAENSCAAVNLWLALELTVDATAVTTGVVGTDSVLVSTLLKPLLAEPSLTCQLMVREVSVPLAVASPPDGLKL